MRVCRNRILGSAGNITPEGVEGSLFRNHAHLESGSVGLFDYLKLFKKAASKAEFTCFS